MASIEDAITALQDEWRELEEPSIPASEPYEPNKALIRAALADLRTALEQGLSAAGGNLMRFATIALRDLETDAAAGQLAYVYANNSDPDDPLNGIYQWDASGEEWVAAPWYFDAVAAVVQPLVDEAEAAAALADDFANAAEDVEVTPGKYSGAHWNAKSENLVADAEAAIADFAGTLEVDPDANYYGATLEGPAGGVYAGARLSDGKLETNALGSYAVDDRLLDLHDQVRVRREFEDYADAPASLPLMFGRAGNGQSNSVGTHGLPLLTTTALYATLALMFNGGPKADPLNPGVTMVSLSPLIEDALSSDGGSNRGETWLSAMAKGFIQRLAMDGTAPADIPITVSHTSGYSGQNLGSMLTTHWPRFTAAIARMNALGVALVGAGNFKILSVPWDGHEANQNTVAAADIADAVLDARDQVVPAVQAAVTGQTEIPQMFWPQKSNLSAERVAAPNESWSAGMTLGILQVDGQGVFVTHPDYCTFLRDDGDNGLHRGPIGHNLAGHYLSRAEYWVLARRKKWEGLKPVGAWYRRGYWYVRYLTPVTPIILDASEIGVTFQHGIKIEDDLGDNALGEFRVFGAGDVIRFESDRTPIQADNPIVRIGLDYLPSRCSLPAGSGGTSIRDSDVEDGLIIGGNTYTGANYSLANKLVPLIMEV